MMHTSEVHQFNDDDSDDLCGREDCRGTPDDPIHCFIRRVSGHHDGPCFGDKHKAAVARRRDTAAPWNALERRDEGNSFRDYLDGQSIHCGTGLLLQARLYREDDFGEWIQLLDRGLRVRYELAWPPGKPDRVVVLHTDVDGYDFTRIGEPWMRFRWPVRSA